MLDRMFAAWVKIPPGDKKEIRSWCRSMVFGWIGYGAILFFSAGTIEWAWGWVFMIILALALIAHPLILIPVNPGLLVERNKGLLQAGVELWDRVVSILGAGIFMVATWVVAGLDYRFGWTAPISGWIHVTAAILHSLGWVLFLWAMKANAFFSEGVRIQTERGHTVVSTGPYRFVRHPGYSGVILSGLWMPPLLGSAWAFLPAGLMIAAYVLRTYLEDRTLQNKLPGYIDYTNSTRFRLIPGVW